MNGWYLIETGKDQKNSELVFLNLEPEKIYGPNVG